MHSRLLQVLETGYSLLEERISFYHVAKTNRRSANKMVTHVYERDGRKKGSLSYIRTLVENVVLCTGNTHNI